MADRFIEYMRLDEIPRAVRNPKNHKADVIAASFKRHGFVESPTIDERTGRLVAGHGRLDELDAAHAANQIAPEGIRVDTEGYWFVPVQRGWASRNDAEAEAYLLTSNQATIAGGWNEPELFPIIIGLQDGPGLDGVGFTDLDIKLLTAQHAPPPVTGEADEAPPTPVTAVTQPGDVWLLGRHRVMCGDCTKPEHVATLLDGATPALTLTDPPYCSGGFNETGKAAGSVGTTATHKQIANDRLSTRGYIALLKSALGCAPGPFAYAFTDWRMWVYLFDVMESSGFGVRSMIVWDKGTPGMGRGWRAQHELVMWAAKSVPPFDNHFSGAGNVVASKRTGNLLHTTQKPVDLLEQLLDVTQFADGVYDPFAGSGSTLIAAHNRGRTFYGMELDAVYADVICQRWMAYTGEPAVHAVTGEPFPSS